MMRPSSSLAQRERARLVLPAHAVEVEDARELLLALVGEARVVDGRGGGRFGFERPDVHRALR